MDVASRGTRRFGCAVQAAVLAALILAVPETAHAWFGWLDKFSGPGPFKGVLLDVRVKCYGKPTNLTNDHLADFVKVIDAVTNTTSDDAREKALRAATELWTAFEKSIQPVGDALDSDYGFAASAVNIRVLSDDKLTPAARVDAALSIVQRIRAQRVTVRALNGLGSTWSLCNDAQARRVSVGLNAELWWTRGDERFAKSKAIGFATFGPSVTYRVPLGRDHEVLDVGLTGGFYTFASRGFKHFGGRFLQPQVTLHFPPVWQVLPHSDARRWLSAVSFRHARTFLQGTLTAAELGATSASPATFNDRYGVGSNALFVNLQTLLPWPQVDPARLSLNSDHARTTRTRRTFP